MARESIKYCKYEKNRPQREKTIYQEEVFTIPSPHLGVKMRGFLRNSGGQTVIEYIIITSLIGIFCLVTVRQLGKVLQKRIEYLKGQITNEISLN